jgi:hypothetical protein
MVIWVKTTIDIADGLLMDAKERAHRSGTTLRALVEEGLRAVLEREEQGQGAFRWLPVTHGGANDPVSQEDIEAAIREARRGRDFPELGEPPPHARDQ